MVAIWEKILSEEIEVTNPSPQSMCPQCGKPNQCRIGSSEGCWCVGRPVSKAALEAALGPFDETKACLCPECLSRFEVEGPQ
jgi:hypothetical protein